MTDKKIKNDDLKKVAGGRQGANPQAQPSFEGDSSSQSKAGGPSKLTPDQANSVSGGRSAPTPKPSLEGDVGAGNPQAQKDDRR